MKDVDVLNNHNLKRTSCREKIIEVVITAKHALSEKESREQLVENYDYTTFHRSFQTLKEHKLNHEFVDDNQLVKYAPDHTVTH